MKSLLVKLKRPDVVKPLVLMTLLMFFQQFSGTATISYYAYEVMASTGRVETSNWSRLSKNCTPIG